MDWPADPQSVNYYVQNNNSVAIQSLKPVLHIINTCQMGLESKTAELSQSLSALRPAVQHSAAALLFKTCLELLGNLKSHSLYSSENKDRFYFCVSIEKVTNLISTKNVFIWSLDENVKDSNIINHGLHSLPCCS